MLNNLNFTLLPHSPFLYHGTSYIQSSLRLWFLLFSHALSLSSALLCNQPSVCVLPYPSTPFLLAPGYLVRLILSLLPTQLSSSPSFLPSFLRCCLNSCLYSPTDSPSIAESKYQTNPNTAKT
jgi:hypothetical protein